MKKVLYICDHAAECGLSRLQCPCATPHTREECCDVGTKCPAVGYVEVRCELSEGQYDETEAKA